jgi:hypothetical protein
VLLLAEVGDLDAISAISPISAICSLNSVGFHIKNGHDQASKRLCVGPGWLHRRDCMASITLTSTDARIFARKAFA